MKKYLIGILVSALMLADRALACFADFGQQMTVGMQAAQDLRTKRFIIVALSAANTVVQATDPGSSLIAGVLENKPNSGQAANVAYLGKSKVVAGGAITANVMITTNSSGKATAVVSGGVAIGRALEAATNDGDVINVLLFHPVRWGGLV